MSDAYGKLSTDCCICTFFTSQLCRLSCLHSPSPSPLVSVWCAVRLCTQASLCCLQSHVHSDTPPTYEAHPFVPLSPLCPPPHAPPPIPIFSTLSALQAPLCPLMIRVMTRLLAVTPRTAPYSPWLRRLPLPFFLTGDRVTDSITKHHRLNLPNASFAHLQLLCFSSVKALTWLC